MAERIIHFDNAREAQDVTGAREEYLPALEQAFGVAAVSRDLWLKLAGEAAPVEAAVDATAAAVAPAVEATADSAAAAVAPAVEAAVEAIAAPAAPAAQVPAPEAIPDPAGD